MPDLKRIHEWMCLNKLSLNVDKTESILNGTRQCYLNANPLNVHISGNRIQSKENGEIPWGSNRPIIKMERTHRESMY